MIKMNTVKIYFDGGSNSSTSSGYGSFEVYGNELHHRTIRKQFGSPLTSNQAEYLALLSALEFLKWHIDPFATSLEIFTDSQLVQRQMTGRYRVKHPRMKFLSDEVKSEIRPYADVQLIWHRRSNNVKRFGH